MDRDNNDSEIHTPSALNKSDTDQSLVGKFKSHVSGIINNTPLSKWFRKNDEKTFRSRDDDQDEELYQMQPPLKKVKHTTASEQEYHFSTPTINVPKSTFTSFPEPVAGPSGIKSRKLLTTTTTLTTTSRNNFNTTDLLNGHKDSDSEESTSGYSSVARISSKEQVFESRDSSKQTSPLENSPTNSRSLFTNKDNNMSRSLFNDSNMSPRLNTSLSTRRPSFNVSTFGSPNFVDKTLSTRKITNSPFYNGRTGYGGAAAYGRRTNRLVSELRKPPTNSIQIKPVNTATETLVSLGKTAQRILSTLEQYSSPVNDAKKIPVASKRFRSENKYSGVNPYSVREAKTASNSELQVPSVSDLLKMKQSKERLQESTESVRQLATSSKSALNVETYKISTNDNEQQRHTGKIKNKMTSVRQKVHVEETVEEVPLTPVALPITVLPKFDIQIPAAPPEVEKVVVPRTTTPLVKARSPIKPLETEAVKPAPVVDYKFAKPFVISENLKSIVGINNYKFSEPLSKKLKADGVVIPTFNFNMPTPKPFGSAPKPKHNGDNVIKPAAQLKMGIFGKSSKDIWECSTCLIKNQPDKTKCVACEATNPKDDVRYSYPLCQGTSPPKTSLSFTSNVTEKFKVDNSGTWECDTCLVRNKSDATKCVACETTKPGAKPEEQATSLFDKFKQPEGSWECGSCLVRNKSDVVKCVACETAKPTSSGFGDKFKTKDNEWECSVCMVKNPATNTKCLCCEALSPNSKASETATMKSLSESKPVGSFNFGIDKSTAQSFSFGVPPSAVAATTIPSTTIASIFGSDAKVDTQPATANFSFGIPAQKPAESKENEKEAPQTSATTVATSKVEDSTTTATTTTATTTPTFNFTKPVNGDSTPKTPAFSFGSKSESPKTNSSFSLPTVSAAPTFNFNAPKPTESTANQSQQQQEVGKAPMFKFGSSAPVTASEPNPFEPPAKVANGFGVTPAATNFNNSTTAPSFGTTANFSSESKTFSFNTNNKTVKEAPVFSFGQPAATPAATGGFNFNAPAAPSTGMFSFNAPKPEIPANPAPANPAPMFGTPPTVKNGTAFNFGASGPNNNNQKAGFSFGASLNTPAPSGGFNFGAAPAAALSTGGFNFNAAPPTFDANVKPSFNFSQGQAVTGFSAQPTAGADLTGQRKIRKAVRRTQR